MPKVSAEYTPYSTTKPEGPRMPVERVDINFPEVKISNAVGRAMGVAGEGTQALAGAQGAVARAFDELGTQLEKTGDQLWKRAEGLQELQNQNQLSKAELEFEKYVATKKAQFSNLQGEAATEDTYKAYIKDLEDQQKKLGEKLPPTTLTRFNSSTLRQIGHEGIYAAGHVASEIRKVTIATSEARVNQWKDELSKNEDLNRNKEIIEKIEKEILTTQMPAKGMTPELAREAIRKQVGEGYIGQLKNLARTNPWQALKILDSPDNKGLWDDKQYLEAKNQILHERDRLTSRNIATRIQEKDPDARLEDKIEEGVKDAKERNPDAKDLPEMVRNAIRERHHTHNEQVNEDRREADRLARHILSGGANPDGVRPKTLDQFYRDGGEEGRRAYDRAGKDGQAQIRKQLNRNAMGLVDPTPESEDLKWTLRGLRTQDPAHFRDMDLDQFEDLTLADKNALKAEQDKLRKEGIKLEDDPKVGRALNIALSEAMVDKRIKENKTKWLRFQGVFADAVHSMQKEVGYDKPLTPDQIRSIVNMLQDKETSIGRKWGFGYKEVKEGDPLYERLKEIPEDKKLEMMKRYPGLSEPEMLTRYRRNQLQLEWEKKFAPKHAY